MHYHAICRATEPSKVLTLHPIAPVPRVYSIRWSIQSHNVYLLLWKIRVIDQRATHAGAQFLGRLPPKSLIHFWATADLLQP